jgi:hypothetical protein
MVYFVDVECKERFRIWLSGKCLGFAIDELDESVLNACEKVGGIDLCIH